MKLIRCDRKALFAFMAPALIVMLLFFVIPVLYVIVVSFLKWNGISAPVFNNLKNYALLTKDKSFSRSHFIPQAEGLEILPDGLFLPAGDLRHCSRNTMACHL